MKVSFTTAAMAVDNTTNVIRVAPEINSFPTLCKFVCHTRLLVPDLTATTRVSPLYILSIGTTPRHLVIVVKNVLLTFRSATAELTAEARDGGS